MSLSNPATGTLVLWISVKNWLLARIFCPAP
jgi:hypothetical protein